MGLDQSKPSSLDVCVEGAEILFIAYFTILLVQEQTSQLAVCISQFLRLSKQRQDDSAYPVRRGSLSEVFVCHPLHSIPLFTEKQEIRKLTVPRGASEKVLRFGKTVHP